MWSCDGAKQFTVCLTQQVKSYTSLKDVEKNPQIILSAPLWLVAVQEMTTSFPFRLMTPALVSVILRLPLVSFEEVPLWCLSF